MKRTYKTLIYVTSICENHYADFQLKFFSQWIYRRLLWLSFWSDRFLHIYIYIWPNCFFFPLIFSQRFQVQCQFLCEQLKQEKKVGAGLMVGWWREGKLRAAAAAAKLAITAGVAELPICDQNNMKIDLYIYICFMHVCVCLIWDKNGLVNFMLFLVLFNKLFFLLVSLWYILYFNLLDYGFSFLSYLFSFGNQF